jgi:hypothetical protein
MKCQHHRLVDNLNAALATLPARLLLLGGLIGGFFGGFNPTGPAPRIQWAFGKGDIEWLHSILLREIRPGLTEGRGANPSASS